MGFGFWWVQEVVETATFNVEHPKSQHKLERKSDWIPICATCIPSTQTTYHVNPNKDYTHLSEDTNLNYV